MNKEAMLREIEDTLQGAFPGRLKGVVLYGSLARAEETEDSDIDVLVLLEGPIEFGRDLETCIRALYPLSLDWDRPISAKPAEERDYEEAEYPLYRAAKADGIRL